MSVPKRRKTSSKTKKGRSHQALEKTTFSKCSKCGAPVKSHRACTECGNYKTRTVMKTRTDKKAAQMAKKEAKEKAAAKPKA
ncbi:50S ribosomal protein L32 [Candidatus Falkowbacteria bacterium CG10_big_fil_rev_8_21_14_0_10_39_11]|uniref:Large ribosomal subunit protein bL32 n=1 Tax=Candidatus Falkowbacteria bacterium CG10_big_fil_rev_8_21_14_0_10_39_11 TaxID=1974565 RepID=A0A2H0V4D8_9BACT|nr:MAG: 50S ribosomal protein L32 [Candidatus Falkowbacteria bacterium CG10_big_fil_rev_8_21_14_0_10_39_11]